MSSFTDLIDVASERLGGEAVAANDEFFAPKENLLKPGRGVFLEHEYTERGKWMDGWETRRRREPGHDWCIIRLGLPGVVHGFDVDTNFFRGNFPDACSIDACALDTDRPVDELVTGAGPVAWTELIPKTKLQGHSQNLIGVSAPRRATHLRLNIHPDGGVARFRVYAEVAPDWSRLLRRAHAGELIDVGAIENGGLALVCSDMFFGNRHNMLMPGRAPNMGDGWETRRRRGPGHDWAIIRLGRRGIIRRIEVDTNHFKGNYPDTCDIECCDAPPGAATDWLAGPGSAWAPLLPRTKVRAATRHFFEKELAAPRACTHARVNIYPDGGISRLRLHAEITDGAGP